MTSRTAFLAASIVLLVAFAPTATASHPCVDEPLCQPHEEPHPKEIVQAVWERVQCLFVTQPPTACV